MEIATLALLEELDAAHVPYSRVNTADPNDTLENRGRWTSHNALLALRDIGVMARRAAARDVRAVYLPFAQEFPGLLRDVIFIAIGNVLRKPVIVHLHGGSFGNYFLSRRRLTRLALRATIGRAAIGIVLTENLRPSLECILPKERVVVVSNGVDLLSPIDSVTAPVGEVRFLFLSSLIPSKGTLVFLEAFAEAFNVRPSLRATMAGTWPSAELQDEMRGLAERLEVQHVVNFVGPVYGEEKASLFADADAFCLPSYYPLEGQPLVVIEAMAAGLPVIATAWRGIADTVDDEVTGFLIARADAGLLAERMIYLADRPDERQRLGRAGRVRYETSFTQRAFGDRMVKVLAPFLTHSVGSRASSSHKRLR
ncbi:MAG: glycosyltransferase family 4 protein [Gaiellaceae bacterium]